MIVKFTVLVCTTYIIYLYCNCNSISLSLVEVQGLKRVADTQLPMWNY